MADDALATEQMQQIRGQLPTWWKGRPAAFALYDTDAQLRVGQSPGIAGPRLLVVRGRFGGKGDAQFFIQLNEQAQKLKLPKITPDEGDFGADHCKWAGVDTVCWPTSARLSVSVLTVFGPADPERNATEVDEAWQAAL